MHTHFQTYAATLPATRRARGGTALGWLALAIGCFAPGLHADPTLYPQADPTAAEQFLLQQLNRARMDPAGEGQRLADWLRSTADGKAVVARFGINPSQVKADFAALPAVPPLALDASLLAATRAHSADLATHNGVGPGGDAHAGYDGSTVITRDQAAGYLGACQGEDVVINASSLETVHAGLCVDWGVPNLGHRLTRMCGAQGGNVVGVGLANLAGGAYVETEDFGSPPLVVNHGAVVIADAPAMLLGVVYRDANANGRYDPGEGVAGVSVTMDGGKFYAVTTASGGYSLPLVHADGTNAMDAVVVRMSGLPNESADRAQVVRITGFPTEFGAYRQNVEWEVVPGNPSAGVAAGPSLAALFTGAAALGNGWYYLGFGSGTVFGYYHVAAYPYVLHDDLGWEYMQDAHDGKAGAYLYDFASGDWWYTSPSFGFPYLYDFARHTVLFYFPASGQPDHGSSAPRYFYDFAAGQVITL